MVPYLHNSAVLNAFGPVSNKEWNDWKWQLKNRITTVDGLGKILPLSEKEAEERSKVSRRYPMSITPYYLSLINPKDPEDPIRKQSVPSILELCDNEEMLDETYGSVNYSVTKALEHMYKDIALLKVTYVCEGNCRHCFRRNKVGREQWTISEKELDDALSYIRKNPSITRVLVTGGEPFILPETKLRKILRGLKEAGIKKIRIGSRAPIMLPQRITDGFAEFLAEFSPLRVDVHYNHPNELSEESLAAIRRLKAKGIEVANCSVLLKGINSDFDTLYRLFYKLVENGVYIYRLYHPMPVKGSDHLRPSVETGLKIMNQFSSVSGDLTPDYKIPTPCGKVNPFSDIIGKEGRYLRIKHRGKAFNYFDGID